MSIVASTRGGALAEDAAFFRKPFAAQGASESSFIKIRSFVKRISGRLRETRKSFIRTEIVSHRRVLRADINPHPVHCQSSSCRFARASAIRGRLFFRAAVEGRQKRGNLNGEIARIPAPGAGRRFRTPIPLQAVAGIISARKRTDASRKRDSPASAARMESEPIRGRHSRRGSLPQGGIAERREPKRKKLLKDLVFPPCRTLGFGFDCGIRYAGRGTVSGLDPCQHWLLDGSWPSPR